MRLSNLKSAICGTEKLVINDIEIVTHEVPIEDGEGNESTFREDEWHVSVRPYKRDACRCPKCNRKCPGYDHQPLRCWRTVDVGTSRCYLEYAPMRVNCPEHGPIVEAVPWADHKAKLTRAMDEQIAWAMCHLCKSAVRELFRVSGATVGNACNRVLARCVDQDELLDGLRRIGIDETGWGNHKVMTTVVDHDRCRVVWAGEGIGGDALQPFFDLLGEERCQQIEVVTADGAPWIAKAVKENLKGAEPAMDPFHVVKWGTDALDDVRRRALSVAREELKKVPKGKRGRPAKDDPVAKLRAVANAKVKEIEGTRWSLLKNPEDLTDKQRETLDKVSRANRELYRAYNLKEGLRDVFSLGAGDPELAETLLDTWLSRACRSRIDEFVKVSRSVRERRDNILRAIELGLSNSRLEAVNNKIKVAIRMGYGYKSFENLKAVVMLRCCGVRLTLPGRMPRGWRTKGSSRRNREQMEKKRLAAEEMSRSQAEAGAAEAMAAS